MVHRRLILTALLVLVAGSVGIIARREQTPNRKRLLFFSQDAGLLELPV